MSREYILAEMQHGNLKQLVCFDREFNYYQMWICGYSLMYRQKRYKDGRRCYYLTEQLARVLGFNCLFEMKLFLRTLQWWRGFVSVERLRVAFARYEAKWGDCV